MKAPAIQSASDLQAWFEQEPAKLIGTPTKKWTDSRERPTRERAPVFDGYAEADELTRQEDCAIDFAATLNNLEDLLG